MKKDWNEDLYMNIAFSEIGAIPDRSGKIERSYKNGADLKGFSEDGETPLTAAILGGKGSPKAVSELLRLGADPNQKDKQGWSPWTACISRSDDSSVSHRMVKIKELLKGVVVDKSEESLIHLQHEILNKDIAKVKALLEKGLDINSPIISPLGCAIIREDLDMMELLLQYNASPEGSEGEEETCLMDASKIGNLDIVKLLLGHGADSSVYAWGDKKWTAEFIAKNNGHPEVATYLKQWNKNPSKTKPINKKFKALYDNHTNGINYGFSTDDIVKKLENWDSKYGVTISDIDEASLKVKFDCLPKNVEKLSHEIYEFCPDVIDQGFGCMDDMVEMMDQSGLKIELEIAKIIEGIDFNEEDFGLKILQNDLKLNSILNLWWD